MKDKAPLNKSRRIGDWSLRVYDEDSAPIDLLEKLISSGPAQARAGAFKTTSGRRTIWIYKTGPSKDQSIFIKHYSMPRLLKQFKYLFRNSRTRQEWFMGCRLLEMGLPAAKPLAMAERRKRGLLREDYLFEEALTGHENFDSWFAKNFGACDEVSSALRPDAKKRHETIHALAELVRRMHELGVMQRDFKPDSIMVGPEGDFKLVDLERVLIKKRGLSLSDRLKNLAKIDQAFGHIGNDSDRLRFLKHYFKDEKPGKDKLAEYGRSISHLSEIEFRKEARDRRAWIFTSNESYANWSYRGFAVYSYKKSIRPFVKAVIDSAIEGKVFSGGKFAGDPEFVYNVRWCNAVTAFALSPQLRYRRVPHVVPEAAVRPRASDDFGVLICPRERGEWHRLGDAFRGVPGDEEKAELCLDLGRFLRVLHFMGITWQRHPQDFMLCNAGASSFQKKFLLNRLELLVTDRTPSPLQARRVIDEIGVVAGLGREHVKLVQEGHEGRMPRHFTEFICLRLPRDYERP